MKEDIISTIRETLSSGKNISEATPIEEIAKGSMDIVELVAVLKNKYNLSIQPSEMNHIKTVGDIVKYVQTHKDSGISKSPLESF
mgnify:CR=1 FL=1